MRFLLSCCLLAIALTVVVPRSVAQSSLPSIAATESAAASVTLTFTFPSTGVDYSIYQAGGDARLYVRVASSNLPSYKLTPTDLRLVTVANDPSDLDCVLFSVPVKRGTLPRIDRKQSDLKITFTPEPASLMSSAQPDNVPQNSDSTPRTLRAVESIAGANLVPVANSAPVPAATATPAPNPLVTAVPFDVDKKLLAFADADLAVPESPAFTVLGVTPETVVRPSSPREFASSLLNGVDRHGNFQSGVALDFAPYLTLAADEMTLGQYRSHYKLRFLSRTQFSFANTKGASDDDKSVRLALGLRFTLWDKGDPHSDDVLMDCFTRVGSALFNIPIPSILPPDQLPATTSAADKALSAAAWEAYELKQKEFDSSKNEGYEQCRAEGRKRNWNKSSWIVAFAPSWISPTGLSKNFNWNGAGFWTSVAYGFEGIPSLEKHSQLILHARYRSNEQVADPNNKGKFLNQDSLFLGTRLRIGNENSTASFEGSLIRSRSGNQGFDNSARYSVGLERRIADNLWFALAFGGDSGRSDGENKGFVLTSFKWGFTPKRQFDPAPGK